MSHWEITQELTMTPLELALSLLAIKPAGLPEPDFEPAVYPPP